MLKLIQNMAASCCLYLLTRNRTRNFSHVFPISRNLRPISKFQKYIPTTRSYTTPDSTKKQGNIVSVSATFLDHDGNKLCTVTGPVGSSLYDLLEESVENIEGFGSCGGELACTSCHVILSTEDYRRVLDKMGDEECDLLSTHSEVTKTSRLGCQVKITKELSGISVKIGPDVLLY